MTEPTAYEEAVAARAHWEHAIREENRRHDDTMRRLNRALTKAQRIITSADTGLVSADDTIIAQRFLTVTWGRDHIRTPEVYSAFTDAIRDLQDGCERLRRGYFGVKAYDRWYSQRSDHAYGMGPAHGGIWFSIGIRGAAADVPMLEDRLACIRWLSAVLVAPDRLL